MQLRDHMPVDRYCAALPLARGADGRYWVMLIQGRRSAAWVVPRTVVRPGTPAHLTAAGEAFVQAGLCGSVAEEPIGEYRLLLSSEGNQRAVAEVEVFALAVDEQLETPEVCAGRPAMWVPLKDAPAMVVERGLGRILEATNVRLRDLSDEP